MKKPLVSVIISMHNAAKFLEEAIHSIRIQDYPNIEIIAIDDGSTDESVAIIRKHPDISLYTQDELGESKTRNAGIKKSKGEFVAFLDPDDLFLPGKISSQVDYLLMNPKIQMVVTLCEGFLQDGLVEPSWARKNSLNIPHKNLSPSAWVIKKNLFDEIGMIDESLNSGCDFEWIQRVWRSGREIGVIDEVLWKKRVHSSNASAFVNKGKIKTYYHELLTILKRSSN